MRHISPLYKEMDSLIIEQYTQFATESENSVEDLIVYERHET